MNESDTDRPQIATRTCLPTQTKFLHRYPNAQLTDGAGRDGRNTWSDDFVGGLKMLRGHRRVAGRVN